MTNTTLSSFPPPPLYDSLRFLDLQIARALANEPDLLLLDEATGDLDRRNAVSVMDLLLDLNIKGCTMVMGGSACWMGGTMPLSVLSSGGVWRVGPPSLSSVCVCPFVSPRWLGAVTHDPDLECYADRIIYVEDGTLRRQAINRYQTRIDFDSYMEALNSRRG